MTNREITILKQGIESGVSAKYRIIEIWACKKVIKNFHQWADGKTCKGAFLISYIYDVSYWFLLSEWKPTKYYLIPLDKNRINPILEIHKFIDKQLEWTYKPTKNVLASKEA